MGLVALSGRTLASEWCASHVTRSECLVFRFQHDCVWDRTAGCVKDQPCRERDADRCEYELTSSSEAWDQSRNRCFLSAAEGCRATDECLGEASEGACVRGGCSWERRCAPVDTRNFPGPGVCRHACVPPGTPAGRDAGDAEAFGWLAPEAEARCAAKSQRCSREAPDGARRR